MKQGILIKKYVGKFVDWNKNITFVKTLNFRKF
jgi:hypothetical protein